MEGTRSGMWGRVHSTRWGRFFSLTCFWWVEPPPSYMSGFLPSPSSQLANKVSTSAQYLSAEQNPDLPQRDNAPNPSSNFLGVAPRPPKYTPQNGMEVPPKYTTLRLKFQNSHMPPPSNGMEESPKCTILRFRCQIPSRTPSRTYHSVPRTWRYAPRKYPISSKKTKICSKHFQFGQPWLLCNTLLNLSHVTPGY